MKRCLTGTPVGVATLKVRKGAFDALNKGSGALGKGELKLSPNLKSLAIWASKLLSDFHFGVLGSLLGTEIQPEVLLTEVFFFSPPRVVDVRALGSWMSAPKCLFFQDFEGLTEVLPDICVDVRGVSGPKTYSLGCFFVPDFSWEATNGGAKRIVRFFGGKMYYRAHPPKLVLEASESGIRLVCACFF